MSVTPPNRWPRHAAAGIARTVLITFAGLLFWSALPVVLGWQPTVVMSGSMEPAIQTGDVVVTREIAAHALRPGHVLLVEDPTAPGSRLLHRFDHADENGEIVLRGDANEDVDSTPAAYDDVIGVGVLRVPWVGLPYVWASQGRYLTVALTAIALLWLLALSPIRERATVPTADGADGDDGRSGQGGGAGGDVDAGAADAEEVTSSQVLRAGGRHALVGAGAAVLIVAGVATGTLSTPASAAFTDSATMSATFTAAAVFPEVPADSSATAPAAGEPAGAPDPADTSPVEAQVDVGADPSQTHRFGSDVPQDADSGTSTTVVKSPSEVDLSTDEELTACPSPGEDCSAPPAAD